MKKIPLSQGRVALVDDDDYERLSKHKWYAQWNPGARGYYAVRTSKRDVRGKHHSICMHREIMHAQPGQECDPLDHNGLNNYKQNLRLCTRAENQHNRKKHKKGSSQHKGVCWHKRTHKWQARVQSDGKQHSLGYFTDEKEAARAYDRAAKKHFGEFAKLNFSNTGVSK